MEQEYILLIMNCIKYRYKAERQQKSWLQDLPGFLIYFHVIGDEMLLSDYEFDYGANILYVKVADDYNSLPKKVMAAFKAISNTYKYKYIFKTDDDQHLTNINFLNIVKNLLDTVFPRIHYGGKIVDVDKPYLSQYYRIHPELPKELKILKTKYCNGRFYILSREAVDNLLLCTDKINQEYFEDYAIGLNLNDIYKISMLRLNTDVFIDAV